MLTGEASKETHPEVPDTAGVIRGPSQRSSAAPLGGPKGTAPGGCPAGKVTGQRPRIVQTSGPGPKPTACSRPERRQGRAAERCRPPPGSAQPARHERTLPATSARQRRTGGEGRQPLPRGLGQGSSERTEERRPTSARPEGAGPSVPTGVALPTATGTKVSSIAAGHREVKSLAPGHTTSAARARL